MTEPPAATRTRFPAPFLNVLVNTLFVSVIDFTVFFAITFFVYLETRSVFATAIIAGLYLVITAGTGIWFGSLVDHHRKKSVMMLSTAVSAVLYVLALVLERTAAPGAFADPASVRLWVFVVVLMCGVIAGNIRGIAMPTLVTILIDEDRRDRANGLVGSAQGVSFLVTSVISGVLVAWGGMFAVLVVALAINLAAMVHLSWVQVPEKQIVPVEGAAGKTDLRGTYRMVRRTPGLLALILFSTFNNFLGGAFMALMDAYGLSMMSVRAWGFLWGVLSTGLIIGGLLIARIGLGGNPVRTLLTANLVLWVVTVAFPLQPSVLMLSVGMYVYMLLVPFVEAAEQTVLQRVVPLERQGRVFGFAQSVEQSASPLTAFLIGPIAQFLFIPFMTDGAGADWIGGWFGTGPARGLALVFILVAIIGLVVTGWALRSRFYRLLSRQYREAPPEPPETGRPGGVVTLPTDVEQAR
jgi:DHA3 family multidrug efflux protein-like MFS transporter